MTVQDALVAPRVTSRVTVAAVAALGVAIVLVLSAVHLTQGTSSVSAADLLARGLPADRRPQYASAIR